MSFVTILLVPSQLGCRIYLYAVDIHVIQYINSYRAAGSSSKAAIGYSYGEEVVGDYNASGNDSDQESVHEMEGEPSVYS